MEVKGFQATVEIDGEDIQHLIKRGTCSVSAGGRGASVNIKCRDEYRLMVEEVED